MKKLEVLTSGARSISDRRQTRIVSVPRRRTSGSAKTALNFAGIALALSSSVRLPLIARVVMFTVPLLTCAGRIHARAVESPDRMTQEVNRCLNMVRVAASRRQARLATPTRDALFVSKRV